MRSWGVWGDFVNGLKKKKKIAKNHTTNHTIWLINKMFIWHASAECDSQLHVYISLVSCACLLVSVTAVSQPLSCHTTLYSDIVFWNTYFAKSRRHELDFCFCLTQQWRQLRCVLNTGSYMVLGETHKKHTKHALYKNMHSTPLQTPSTNTWRLTYPYPITASIALFRWLRHSPGILTFWHSGNPFSCQRTGTCQNTHGQYPHTWRIGLCVTIPWSGDGDWMTVSPQRVCTYDSCHWPPPLAQTLSQHSSLCYYCLLSPATWGVYPCRACREYELGDTKLPDKAANTKPCQWVLKYHGSASVELSNHRVNSQLVSGKLILFKVSFDRARFSCEQVQTKLVLGAVSGISWYWGVVGGGNMPISNSQLSTTNIEWARSISILVGFCW